MTGVGCIRQFHHYTGEEFGNLFSVTKYAVSRWEKGNIPEKKKKEIAKYFSCDEHLLEKELTVIEQLELQKQLTENKLSNPSLIDECECTLHDTAKFATMYQELIEEKWFNIKRENFEDKTFISFVERIQDICDTPNGDLCMYLTLAAIEECLGITPKYEKQTTGEKNYARNTFYETDEIFAIIRNALKIALDN